MTFIDNFKDKKDIHSPPIIPYLVLSYLVFIPLIIILTFVNSILFIKSCDDKEYEKKYNIINGNPHIRNTPIVTLVLSLIVFFLFIYIIINIVFKIKLIGKEFAYYLFGFFYFLFSVFSLISSIIYIIKYSNDNQHLRDSNDQLVRDSNNQLVKDSQKDFNLGLNICILLCVGSHIAIFPTYMFGLTMNFMEQNML